MSDDGEPVIEDSIGLTQDDDRAAKLTHFPQTRVRNMMKLDPDLHLANKESVFLLTRATVSDRHDCCFGKFNLIYKIKSNLTFPL